MTDGGMVYDFNHIDSVSGAIASFVSSMNQQLSEVDSVFNNLLADGWTGAGAQAFQGCKTQWHNNADQMAQTLQTLSTKVSQAGANMNQADQSAAGRF